MASDRGDGGDGGAGGDDDNDNVIKPNINHQIKQEAWWQTTLQVNKKKKYKH